MKRKLTGLLIVLVLCSLCAAEIPGRTAQAAGNNGNEPLKITFLGGDTSGVWYMVLNGVTMCINKSYPGSVVTVTPGANMTNVLRISERQGDCSMAHSTMVGWAAAGQEPYKEKAPNIATVASLYPSHFQLAVQKKMGIKSLDELARKKPKIRLSVGNPGSAAELATKQVLGEYGVSYQDIEAWGGKVEFKNMGTSAEMLANGLIDAWGFVSLYPTPQLEEASLNRELIMLAPKASVISRLCAKYGYSKGVIPAKAYSFSDRELATIVAYAVIIVPKDGPDEIAYKIARAIHDNLDYLRSVNAALKDLAPKDLVQNLGVPLHPGAAKYYKEAGVIKK